MGKQVSVIQVNGRVGEVVGAKSMKGDNILRAHRATIANPNTIPQQTQRTKFLAVSNFANNLPKEAIMGLRPYAKSARCSMRNALTKLYLRYPGNTSDTPSNQLVRVNSYGTVPGEQMVADLTPDLMFFSKGNLPLPITRPMGVDNPLEVVVTDTVAPGIDRARTNLVIVLRNEFGAIITKVAALPAEGNLTHTISVPSSWNGVKVRGYVYYQTFEQPEQRTVHYTALLASAESTSKALESNAQYSDTNFMGEANIS